jgi:hypothetical protein
MASTQRASLLNATGLVAASTDGDKQSLPTRARNHIGYLVVANPNGATTVAAKIQHSPDGVNAWTDLITFTTTSAGASVKEVIVPTTDRLLPYVRAQVVLGGATKLADVSVDLYVENYAG